MSFVFRLFKSEPFRDAQLGDLHHSFGHWKGTIVLTPGGTFRLSLAGTRNAPDPTALEVG